MIKHRQMANLRQLSDSLTELLQLDSKVVTVKRMENKDALKDIRGFWYGDSETAKKALETYPKPSSVKA